jgi:hypothetical protein
VTYYCYNPASGMGESHTDYGVGLSSGKVNPAFAQHLAMLKRLKQHETRRPQKQTKKRGKS